MSSERRIFSLVLALVSSPQGLTKRDLLSTVYGYADRYRHDESDVALERQFERDKDQLRELGIPIETIDSPLESGNNKLTRYRISKQLLQMPSDVRFTARELALLRLAALAWREGSLTDESRRSTMKLEALGAGLDVQHLGIAPQLGIPEPAAAPVQRAIDLGVAVRFDYQLPDREAPLARRVAPLRLHRADGRWHLIAFDLERSADRVFLLSRITSPVVVETATFDPRLRERVDAVIDELLARERDQLATIEASVGSVAEARLAGRARVPIADGGPTGRPTRLEIGTLDWFELATELAGYGEQVAVISPTGLRETVVAELEQIRQQHEGVGRSAPLADARDTPARNRGRASLRTPDRVVLLLSLVPYLLEHGDTPIDELAAAFMVDPGLLRELIEFLGTAGIPGETHTYQDEDLFDIDWEALESENVVRLTRVVAVDDAPRFSANERATLVAGLNSLIPLLPEAERGHARSALEKLGFSAEDARVAAVTVTAGPDDPRLAALADAVDAGRRVSFVYRDLRGSETTRTVDPRFLSQSAGSWYLRGYCLDREAERTFLVDSMRDVHPIGPSDARTGEGAETPSALGPSNATLPATLRVREAALHRISTFSPRVLGPADAGWIVIRVELVHAAAALRMIQAAPGDVIVDSPDEARRGAREWAGRALARYDS